MAIIGRAGLVAAITLLVTAAGAQEPSGVVVKSQPSARAESNAGSRVIHAASNVFRRDTIVTGSAGEAQIRLIDDTRLVVGPRSKLLIDEFVVDGGGADRVAINAVRGAFRFISGGSRQAAYEITTPSATIGLRGTEFDVTVDNDGATNVVVLSGGVRMCGRRRCIDLVGECAVGTVRRREDPREIDVQTIGPDGIAETFPYVRSQQTLWTDFRVASASSCGSQAASVPAISEGENDPSPGPISPAAAPDPAPPGPQPPDPPPPPAPPPPAPPPPDDDDDGGDDEDDDGDDRGDDNEDSGGDN